MNPMEVAEWREKELTKRVKQTRWRPQFDPKKGKKFYYDKLSQKSTWEKPDDIQKIENELDAEILERNRLLQSGSPNQSQSVIGDASNDVANTTSVVSSSQTTTADGFIVPNPRAFKISSTSSSIDVATAALKEGSVQRRIVKRKRSTEDEEEADARPTEGGASGKRFPRSLISSTSSVDAITTFAASEPHNQANNEVHSAVLKGPRYDYPLSHCGERDNDHGGKTALRTKQLNQMPLVVTRLNKESKILLDDAMEVDLSVGTVQTHAAASGSGRDAQRDADDSSDLDDNDDDYDVVFTEEDGKEDEHYTGEYLSYPKAAATGDNMAARSAHVATDMAASTRAVSTESSFSRAIGEADQKMLEATLSQRDSILEKNAIRDAKRLIKHYKVHPTVAVKKFVGSYHGYPIMCRITAECIAASLRMQMQQQAKQSTSKARPSGVGSTEAESSTPRIRAAVVSTTNKAVGAARSSASAESILKDALGGMLRQRLEAAILHGERDPLMGVDRIVTHFDATPRWLIDLLTEPRYRRLLLELGLGPWAPGQGLRASAPSYAAGQSAMQKIGKRDIKCATCSTKTVFFGLCVREMSRLGYNAEIARVLRLPPEDTSVLQNMLVEMLIEAAVEFADKEKEENLAYEPNLSMSPQMSDFLRVFSSNGYAYACAMDFFDLLTSFLAHASRSAASIHSVSKASSGLGRKEEEMEMEKAGSAGGKLSSVGSSNAVGGESGDTVREHTTSSNITSSSGSGSSNRSNCSSSSSGGSSTANEAVAVSSGDAGVSLERAFESMRERARRTVRIVVCAIRQELQYRFFRRKLLQPLSAAGEGEEEGKGENGEQTQSDSGKRTGTHSVDMLRGIPIPTPLNTHGGIAGSGGGGGGGSAAYLLAGDVHTRLAEQITRHTMVSAHMHPLLAHSDALSAPLSSLSSFSASAATLPGSSVSLTKSLSLSQTERAASLPHQQRPKSSSSMQPLSVAIRPIAAETGAMSVLIARKDLANWPRRPKLEEKVLSLEKPASRTAIASVQPQGNDVARKELLWEIFAASRNLLIGDVSADLWLEGPTEEVEENTSRPKQAANAPAPALSFSSSSSSSSSSSLASTGGANGAGGGGNVGTANEGRSVYDCKSTAGLAHEGASSAKCTKSSQGDTDVESAATTQDTAVSPSALTSQPIESTTVGLEPGNDVDVNADADPQAAVEKHSADSKSPHNGTAATAAPVHAIAVQEPSRTSSESVFIPAPAKALPQSSSVLSLIQQQGAEVSGSSPDGTAVDAIATSLTPAEQLQRLQEKVDEAWTEEGRARIKDISSLLRQALKAEDMSMVQCRQLHRLLLGRSVRRSSDVTLETLSRSLAGLCAPAPPPFYPQLDSTFISAARTVGTAGSAAASGKGKGTYSSGSSSCADEGGRLGPIAVPLLTSAHTLRLLTQLFLLKIAPEYETTSNITSINGSISNSSSAGKGSGSEAVLAGGAGLSAERNKKRAKDDLMKKDEDKDQKRLGRRERRRELTCIAHVIAFTVGCTSIMRTGAVPKAEEGGGRDGRREGMQNNLIEVLHAEVIAVQQGLLESVRPLTHLATRGTAAAGKRQLAGEEQMSDTRESGGNRENSKGSSRPKTDADPDMSLALLGELVPRHHVFAVLALQCMSNTMLQEMKQCGDREAQQLNKRLSAGDSAAYGAGGGGVGGAAFCRAVNIGGSSSTSGVGGKMSATAASFLMKSQLRKSSFSSGVSKTIGPSGRGKDEVLPMKQEGTKGGTAVKDGEDGPNNEKLRIGTIFWEKMSIFCRILPLAVERFPSLGMDCVALCQAALQLLLLINSINLSNSLKSCKEEIRAAKRLVACLMRVGISGVCLKGPGSSMDAIEFSHTQALLLLLDHLEPLSKIHSSVLEHAFAELLAAVPKSMLLSSAASSVALGPALCALAMLRHSRMRPMMNRITASQTLLSDRGLAAAGAAAGAQAEAEKQGKAKQALFSLFRGIAKALEDAEAAAGRTTEVEIAAGSKSAETLTAPAAVLADSVGADAVVSLNTSENAVSSSNNNDNNNDNNNSSSGRECRTAGTISGNEGPDHTHTTEEKNGFGAEKHPPLLQHCRPYSDLLSCMQLYKNIVCDILRSLE